MKLVEHTVIRCKLDQELHLEDARRLRGAIGRIMDRPEFHHHAATGLVYQHPLIRYDVQGSEAIIAGLAEGAFLLRSLPALPPLRLGAREVGIVDQTVELGRAEVGPCPKPIIYSFQTPYLALNQDNYDVWRLARRACRSASRRSRTAASGCPSPRGAER
jgi:hypothetical protein